MRNLSPALSPAARFRAAAVAFALAPGLLPAAAPAATQAADPEEIEVVTRAEKARRTPGAAETVAFQGELATALSRGNTETFLLSTNARLTWAFADRWLSETRGTALYEESFDVNTANKWAVFERVDRFVSERFSAFAGLGIERDPFSALDYRHSAQLGAAFLVIEDLVQDEGEEVVRNKLQVELGAYAARETFVVPPNAPPDTVLDDRARDVIAARAAAGYQHAFRRGTSAGVEVEAIQDFVDTENFVLNDSVWVAAALVDGLALKLTFTHRYDALPASEEVEKNDLLLTAGLVVSL